MKLRYFVGFLLLHLIPIWAFDYFVTQDGPIHLANAWSFVHYFDGSNEVLRQYYTRNPAPAPNWLVQAILGLLMQFVEPRTAEKILASGFVLLLPGSIWYAAEAIRKGAGPVAIFACPLIFTWFLNMGLYNFCFGIAIHFAMTGYWLRIRHVLSLRSAALFSLGLVSLYFTHIFALIGFFVTLAVMIAFDRRFLTRSIAVVGAASLPAAGLALLFVLGKQARIGPPINDTSGLIDRFEAVANLDAFISYRAEEWWLFTAFFALLAIGLGSVIRHVVARKSWSEGSFLLLPVAFLVLYSFMPYWAFHGAFIPERLLYLASLCAVMCLALYWPQATWRQAMSGAAAVISILVMALQTTSMASFNEQLDSLFACDREFAHGDTLLPIRRPSGFGTDSTRLAELDALQHATHYWVIEHGLVNLGNFSGYRRNHPMLYRPEMAPLPSLGCLDCDPPDFDVARYIETTEGSVDYVLVRGFDVRSRLGDDYDSVCVREGLDRVELFRRKSLDATSREQIARGS